MSEQDIMDVSYEQQMRCDEIQRAIHKISGECKPLEECIEEEGKWWEAVSIDDIDRSRPFRFKYHLEDGTYMFRYGEVEL